MSRTYRKDSQKRHEHTKHRRDRGEHRDNRWAQNFSSSERLEPSPRRVAQRFDDEKLFPDTVD